MTKLDEIIRAAIDDYDDVIESCLFPDSLVAEIANEHLPAMTTVLFGLVVEDNALAFGDASVESGEPFAVLSCVVRDKIERALSDHARQRAEETADNVSDYGDECVLTLDNGNTVRTDTYDDNPAGASYVRVCDPTGVEIAYWSCDEWADDPQLVMGAIFGAAKGSTPDGGVINQSSDDIYESEDDAR